MEQIVLNWQGPVKFSEWKTISKEKGIYFHTVITNVNERITYVGKGDIYECQERHWRKLRKPSDGFYDYLQIKDFDFYEFYSNDNFVMSVYNLINIHPSVNWLNWKSLKGKAYFDENFENIIKNSNIYYTELKDYSDEIIMSIEVNLAYYLIRKFNLDVYSDGNYKIGFNNVGGQNKIDQDIIILNDLSLIQNKKIFEDHFLIDKIDLTKEEVATIEAVKSKKLINDN